MLRAPVCTDLMSPPMLKDWIRSNADGAND
jgi:hypothetical protein